MRFLAPLVLLPRIRFAGKMCSGWLGDDDVEEEEEEEEEEAEDGASCSPILMKSSNEISWAPASFLVGSVAAAASSKDNDHTLKDAQFVHILF